MPRARRYASAIVPAIGCDMAKRRRADSGEPRGAGDGPAGASWIGTWQAEEGARLVEGVAQAVEAAIERDEVEQIAMLAGGGVGPFAGGALAVSGPLSRTNRLRPGVLATSPTSQ